MCTDIDLQSAARHRRWTSTRRFCIAHGTQSSPPLLSVPSIQCTSIRMTWPLELTQHHDVHEAQTQGRSRKTEHTLGFVDNFGSPRRITSIRLLSNHVHQVDCESRPSSCFLRASHQQAGQDGAQEVQGRMTSQPRTSSIARRTGPHDVSAMHLKQCSSSRMARLLSLQSDAQSGCCTTRIITHKSFFPSESDRPRTSVNGTGPVTTSKTSAICAQGVLR